MNLFACRCGALVYYRRESSGLRLLCEYDRRYIIAGEGEACGLDVSGRLIQGRWAAPDTPGVVEVTPYHPPRCPAAILEEHRLPYVD